MVPGGLFEVAVACSGIRYLIASFTLGSLFDYLNYTGLKKRSIFILFSLFLPLLANGIRAYGIVMIAHLSDMKYATGADHLVYGWIFFAFVIFIMFAVGSIWSDSVEKQSTEVNNSQQKNIEVVSILKASFAVLLLIAAATGYKSIMQNAVLGKQVNLSEFYPVSESISDQSWLPTFKNPSSVQSGHSDGLDVFVAYYQTNKQNSEMINSTNWEYNKTHWTIVSREDINDTSLLEINNTAGTRRLLAYTFVNTHLVSSSKLKVKLSQSIQAFIGQAQSGIFIAVSKPVDDKNHDRSLLETKLKAISDSAQDLLLDE
jgi:exosortase/archaeosortase family protein